MPTREERLELRMPATKAGEVALRVAVNALAVAVDRDDRAGTVRPTSPHWLERKRAAPGQMLSFSLQQVERMLVVAYHDRRREEAAGLEARGPRLRIATLEKKQARLLAELAEVDASASVRRDGPFVVRLPGLVAVTADGVLERGARVVEMEADRLELSDLHRWALGSDRPRGMCPVYGLNRGCLMVRANVHAHHRELFRAVAGRHMRGAG